METTTFCIRPGEGKALGMACEISTGLRGSGARTRERAASTLNSGPVRWHLNLP